MGRIAFPIFYLVGGLAAGMTHVLVDPTSDVPAVGASGAISAVMGAYVVLYPRARIQSLVFLGFFYQLIAVPSVIVLGFWFALQLIDGFASLGAATEAGGGVAWFAHIGGFVAGAALALPFRFLGRLRPAPPDALAATGTDGAGGARPGARAGAAAAPHPTRRSSRRPHRGADRRPWDNRRMAGDRATEIEMVVESVRVHMRTGRHVLLLKEVGAGRILPVWIGPWEAQAIAMRLQGISAERPLTHDLFAAALNDLGVRVDRVSIVSLADETFHARLVLATADSVHELDARPSDAIALAVRLDCPIYASAAVLDQAAALPDDDDDEDDDGRGGRGREGETRRRRPGAAAARGDRGADRPDQARHLPRVRQQPRPDDPRSGGGTSSQG